METVKKGTCGRGRVRYRGTEGGVEVVVVLYAHLAPTRPCHITHAHRGELAHERSWRVRDREKVGAVM